MSKNEKLKIELDPSLNIIDEDKSNQSIENDRKNNFSINNNDTNSKPAIRKTKTTHNIITIGGIYIAYNSYRKTLGFWGKRFRDVFNSPRWRAAS